MEMGKCYSRKATRSGWNRRLLSLMVVLVTLEITMGESSIHKSTSFNRLCKRCAIKNQVPLSTTVEKSVFHCGMSCVNYRDCVIFDWSQEGVCNAYAGSSSLEWREDAEFRVYEIVNP
ncbi:uncharacterized protein [Asterias amurensis]|uniref:uncharacterized protein n=1 Tax=Asterias amurensis TaxID=7602 RepID=UPI003AB35AF4